MTRQPHQVFLQADKVAAVDIPVIVEVTRLQIAIVNLIQLYRHTQRGYGVAAIGAARVIHIAAEA